VTLRVGTTKDTFEKFQILPRDGYRDTRFYQVAHCPILFAIYSPARNGFVSQSDLS
jgi:hypothetical protein